MKSFGIRKVYIAIKLFFSFFLSFVLLLFFALPMLIISIVIKIDSKGPVIFKQKRLGKNGKEFWMLKFRTMVVGAETMGSGEYCLKDDSRITKFGKLLRRTSLDELPQLFNIFIGEMSFIGPRPPLTYHPYCFDKYTPEQKRRFLVRPGITGLAQISGRKVASWNDRIKIDLEYVDKISLFLDLKILFLTVFKIFKNTDNDNTIKTVKLSPLNYYYYVTDIEKTSLVDEFDIGYIFYDLETLDKNLRQPGDSRKTNLSFSNLKKVREMINKNKFLVRINHFNDDTKKEVDLCVEAGADIIMLPYFKTLVEVKTFLDYVGNRAQKFLLLETKESVEILDEILELEGIDAIHIGLNDLSLSYNSGFMFNILANGLVEKICRQIKMRGIPFGFGGISYINSGAVPAFNILVEHFRLESSMVILSRKFVCESNDSKIYIKDFETKLNTLREKEKMIINQYTIEDFENNKKQLIEKIQKASSEYEKGN